MPNIATALKEEISRLARKELRGEVTALKKAASTHRTEMAVVKRRLAELEKALKAALRQTNQVQRKVAASTAADPAGNEGLRFRASGMASNRQRLGLSAADFGLLVGTTGQSVYAWEQGRAKPRAKYLTAIAALRGVGKKEVAAKLEELKKAA